MRRKLKFGRVGDALTFPFKNPLTLLGIALVPGLVTVASIVAAVEILMAGAGQAAPPDQVWESLAKFALALTAIALLSTLFLVIYAVAIHRLIVCGERPGFVILRFRRYELAYLGVLVLIFIEQRVLDVISGLIRNSFGFVPARELANPALTASDNFTTLLGWAALVLAALVLIWIHLRLALIFPHAAITGRIGFAASWRAMKGNVWRIVLGLIVLGAVFSVIWSLFTAVWLMSAVVSAPPLTPETSMQAVYRNYLILLAPALPVMAILCASGIAYISYAYKDLVEEAEAPPLATGAPAAAPGQ